jgi:hypothetical protein
MADITISSPLGNATVGTRFIVRGTFDTSPTVPPDKKPPATAAAATMSVPCNIQCSLYAAGDDMNPVDTEPAVKNAATGKWWAVLEDLTGNGGDGFKVVASLTIPMSTGGALTDQANPITLDPNRSIRLLFPGNAGAVDRVFPACGSYSKVADNSVVKCILIAGDMTETSANGTLGNSTWYAEVAAPDGGTMTLLAILKDGPDDADPEVAAYFINDLTVS